MSEQKVGSAIVGTVDLSALRPRHPLVVKASGVGGAIIGLVYGLFAHRAETAIIPVDLLLFGLLFGVTALLLDITLKDRPTR